MRLCILLASFLILQTGCSFFRPRPEEPAINSQPEVPTLKEGITELEAGDPTEAYEIFEKIRLQGVMVNDYRQAVYFQGVALYDLKRFEEALVRFREFLSLSEPTSDDQALALYQISLCNEGSGHDVEAIATLLDLQNHASFKSHPTWAAELPMRLATAYARMGNLSEAERQYAIAEVRLQSLRRLWVKEGTTPDWAGQLLFNMGSLTVRQVTAQDFERELGVLQKAQNYLLEVISLGQKKWAPRSSELLIELYRQAWHVIDQVPLEILDDKELALRRQQSQKKKLALTLEGRLREVRKFLASDLDQLNQSANDLLGFVVELQRQIDELAGERAVGDGPTPESLEKEGIRRKGKVVDPSGSLEKRNKKKPSP